MALFGRIVVKAAVNHVRNIPLVARTVTSYKYLKPFEPTHKAEFEVSKNPEEWKYVEWALPPKYVPFPEQKEVYFSGWRPQTDEAVKHPFYVPRNVNHMLPVHLRISKRGLRRVTTIKRIKGDVWALEKDLRAFIEQHSGKEIGTRIDELAGNVFIRGDFVAYVEKWMYSKGF